MKVEQDAIEPQEVDDVTLAFPTNVVGTLLPAMADIPKEFHDWNNPWAGMASRWFFKGAKRSDLKFRDGIDPIRAIRHLQACLGSFEPKHEHKTAGVAYLLSLWLTEPTP